MGWLPDLFGGSSSPRRSSSRARSYAGSSYSSASRHHASTSRYKRSPRDGYVAYLYAKLRHFMREIWRYAQRHPYKVFFMVIMPLVSGGVLHKLAKQFGVNLPGAPSARGASGGHSSSAGYYGSAGYGDERGGAAGGMGGFDMQSLAGGIGTAQSLAGGISGLASLAGMAKRAFVDEDDPDVRRRDERERRYSDERRFSEERRFPDKRRFSDEDRWR